MTVPNIRDTGIDSKKCLLRKRRILLSNAVPGNSVDDPAGMSWRRPWLYRGRKAKGRRNTNWDPTRLAIRPWAVSLEADWSFSPAGYASKMVGLCHM